MEEYVNSRLQLRRQKWLGPCIKIKNAVRIISNNDIVYIPASIATLAQRWPNVNPYVGPTSMCRRWANVDLSIGPTLERQRWPNVAPTSAQRWHTNVGPTLAQRYANCCMPTLYQHWPNGLFDYGLWFEWMHVSMCGSMEYIVITSWYGNVFCVTGLRSPMDSPNKGPGTLALIFA